MKFSRLWLTIFALSASGMMIETVAYRQWRLLLRMDALPLILPLVMVGLAAGAMMFYLVRGKSGACRYSRVRPPGFDFSSLSLIAYAICAPVSFLSLTLGSRLPEFSAMFALGSLFLLFFLFGVWGYMTADIFDRDHDRIFRLYIANLLGTIGGGIIVIAVMETHGTPRAVSASLAAAILAAWVWLFRHASVRRHGEYSISAVALCGMIVLFAAPPESFALLKNQDGKPPVWFGSNSYSQLEMFPVEPLEVLRAPGLRAKPPKTPDVRAWRVYFDRLDFNYTNIIRYSSLEEVRFLEQGLSGLAFLAGDSGRALILGAGGGVEVIQGLLAGYREIDAVEINPLVVEAVRHVGASDFMRSDSVRYHIDDARRFLLRDRPAYDLIFMPHVKGQEVGGVISTQYMYTVELIQRCLENLSPAGTLVIRNHRRDWPSLFATIKAALRAGSVSGDWSVHLASERVKRRAYSLFLLHRGRFTPEQSRRISGFIHANAFTWTRVDMKGDGGAGHVLTDDHPYAVDIRDILTAGGGVPGPGRGSGSTAGIVVRFIVPLVLAVIVLFLLVPIQARISRSDIRGLVVTGGAFFICGGSGFLAAEFLFIERFFLVAGNPTLALGGTVSSLLGGALLASWLLRNVDSGRLAVFVPRFAVVGAFLLGLAYSILEKLTLVPEPSAWLRGTLAASAVFLPGAFMGALFPAGLRLLAEAEQNTIPWSWAVNGVAAVVGGILAKLLAIAFGYRVVLGFAGACYILAGIAWWLFARRLPLVRQ